MRTKALRQTAALVYNVLKGEYMDKIRKIGFVSLMSLIFLIAASLTAFGTGYLPCPKREYFFAYLAGGVLKLI